MQLPWNAPPSNAPTSLTPDGIARRRRMAELLMTQGTDASPVQHWTQGAARLAQALAGTSQMNRADTADAGLRKQAEMKVAAEKAEADKRAAEAAMMPDWKVVAGQGIYDMNPKRNPNGPLQVQKFNQAAKPRRIVTYNKVPYYEDTGERVLPNAQGADANEPEFKEYQTRDANLANRMKTAEQNITIATDPKNPDATNPSRWLNKIWSDDDNLANSPGWMQFQQAKKEWMAALLRKDTGAAVTPQEFEIYDQTYFPQPGEDATTVENKRKSRAQVAADLAAGSGGASDYFEKKRSSKRGVTEPPPGMELDGPALDLKNKYGLE